MIYRSDLETIRDLSVNVYGLYDVIVGELGLDEHGQGQLVEELRYQFDGASDEIRGLRDENVYLEDKVEQLSRTCEMLELENDRLDEENERLIGENSKLRKVLIKGGLNSGEH